MNCIEMRVQGAKVEFTVFVIHTILSILLNTQDIKRLNSHRIESY